MIIDSLRYASDIILSKVPNVLQLRPYTITQEVHTWSGNRVGLGTDTITTTTIYNGTIADGYANLKYRLVNQKDIVLSGGILRDQDVVVGPIVFPFNTGTHTGGIDVLNFSPTATGVNEVFFIIQGPNFPPEGLRHKKIWARSDKNVMYHVYLRNASAK